MNLKKLEDWLPHRSRDVKPSLLVLHATAGATARSSIDHLRGVGSSYHYIIARDGKDSAKSANADGSEPIVFHCVPDEAHAFHTSTKIPAPSGQGSVNKTSIGVSLANIQNRKSHEQYPEKQLAALEELITSLKKKFPSLKWVTTHAICQPWNRADPLLVDAVQVAQRHGLQLWKPTEQEIKEHTPKKTKVK
jgi:N-acetyl-anhydromuramyl-L-alanine amidase AmpD